MASVLYIQVYTLPISTLYPESSLLSIIIVGFGASIRHCSLFFANLTFSCASTQYTVKLIYDRSAFHLPCMQSYFLTHFAPLCENSLNFIRTTRNHRSVKETNRQVKVLYKWHCLPVELFVLWHYRVRVLVPNVDITLYNCRFIAGFYKLTPWSNEWCVLALLWKKMNLKCSISWSPHDFIYTCYNADQFEMSFDMNIRFY